ncbi:hypothetical protein CEXT_405431 [Caerostris extrusa]|uniref:Uncharacterized protein n=1 Tax=Caerostris extrusa TaxID=172846 RepID=A0AAV4NTU0_CAEEX|nr:hypothetical protein CEXT_405431 [Caerostris extrusa]
MLLLRTIPCLACRTLARQLDRRDIIGHNRLLVCKRRDLLARDTVRGFQPNSPYTLSPPHCHYAVRRASFLLKSIISNITSTSNNTQMLCTKRIELDRKFPRTGARRVQDIHIPETRLSERRRTHVPVRFKSDNSLNVQCS